MNLTDLFLNLIVATMALNLWNNFNKSVHNFQFNLGFILTDLFCITYSSYSVS